MEQLKQLLASDDTSNHLLCYQLCKGQGIDLIDVVKLVFHDKDCWRFNNKIHLGTLKIHNVNIYIKIHCDILDKQIKGDVWFSIDLIPYPADFYSEDNIIYSFYNILMKQLKT